jgi:phosphopantothenoylcysteine decarboxylase
LLIAPLSSNSLAKMATGICDNLVTCVVKAWDRSKPMLVAPAMNTFMWENPLTAQHLEVIKHVYNAEVIDTVYKVLACGDEGFGAMAEFGSIVTRVINILH